MAKTKKSGQSAAEEITEGVTELTGSVREKIASTLDVNPVEVESCLKGIEYPKSKAGLVAAAVANMCSPKIIAALQTVPSKKFNSPIDVAKNLRKV